MQHYEGNNIGGIQKVEHCPHYGFSGFYPAVLANGYAWAEIPIKPESGALYLKVDDTVHGLLYTYSGPFFLHNQRDEVEDELYPILGTSRILRITDMNGRIYIIGAPGCPVTITLNASTGQRYVDENGAGFSFQVEQTTKAVHV